MEIYHRNKSALYKLMANRKVLDSSVGLFFFFFQLLYEYMEGLVT